MIRSVARDQGSAGVEAAVALCLKAGGGQKHIVNLGHGVGKETPVANFEAYIRAAKRGF